MANSHNFDIIRKLHIQQNVDILKQGPGSWKEWRGKNPDIQPDFVQAVLNKANLDGAQLTGADLTEADLTKAHLSGADLFLANLTEANLAEANLFGADLTGANLTKANLTGASLMLANLTEADLTGANLERVDLTMANLTEAKLERAKLVGADLEGAKLGGAGLAGADLKLANLTKADLTGADLAGADISYSTLVETNFTNATLQGCRVYGCSAWNLTLKGVEQRDLVISKEGEPQITVDNLEVAQFIYLLLNNEKIRHVIDTITSKVVLILGRFTPERKAILDTLREELRNRDYLPVLFDFDKPVNRDLTETVMTLASLSRFVIADLSDPNSIPHELMSFAETLLSVPVIPIFCPTKDHPETYPMLEHLKRYRQVLEPYYYYTEENLIASFAEKVIEPAETKAKEMKPR
jgi:uncharacterized protein YjbI with pentapeptide repeats